jgi:hypothetical protein
LKVEAGNDTYRFDTDLALGSDTIDESGGGSTRSTSRPPQPAP